MQDHHEDEAPPSSSQRQRRSLPPLAPRNTRPSSSTRDRHHSGSAVSGKPPRLSHRSRAGCWTCRGRKVKCDEIHPRCGPCTRLNRDCDWDHRWSFSDATSSTQSKYTNVSTTGNAVWDSSVRHLTRSPVLIEHDDLPDFAKLATDDDRERKAETRRPGTFGVVVTPDSFSDLPEYAASTPISSRHRRSSLPAYRGSFTFGSTRPNFGRAPDPIDPNVVILERFEDSSPVQSGPPTLPTNSRRDSYAESLHRPSISSPSSIGFGTHTNATHANGRSEDPLIAHFRQYVVPRLVQPQQISFPDAVSQGSTKHALEHEATRFQPLYHAICAISALNLAYARQSSLETALQHYHQALAASIHATTPTDLLSDGVFFRHFLLFVYDICAPMQAEDGGADMWAEHLNHLRRIAIARHAKRGSEPYAYTLWAICELDMYACLLGSGNCEFFRTVLRHNMLPRLEQQIPSLSATSTTGADAFLPSEVHVFPAILSLNQGVVIHASKLAQTAQACRIEAASRGPISAEAFARWQASSTQFQAELHSFWSQSYPDFLGPETPQAGQHLPERVCYVFENALLLYHAATIYARTSLFPGQRRIPVANQADLVADTERRVRAILALAAASQQRFTLERRHAIFPLFIAGVATSSSDAKLHALDLIRAFEGHGIGQNTTRTRRLLAAVCEDQQQRVETGGRLEDTDWLAVAKEKSLGIVNCGL